jgi:hypothetical protein
MGRLICISNRIPTGANPSGGLVVALQDVLERSGGIWIGAAAETVDHPDDRLTPIEGGTFRRLSFDLSHEEKDNFYAGYANSVLWPLFHDRTDLIEIRGEYYDGYRSVNRRIARMIAPELRPDDRIWVHDYHLMPLAYELRLLEARNPIGFFLHTPFPTPLAMQAMPMPARCANGSCASIWSACRRNATWCTRWPASPRSAARWRPRRASWCWGPRRRGSRPSPSASTPAILPGWRRSSSTCCPRASSSRPGR